VLAIRAYLNTVPPVYNPVEPNQLPFPFDIRTSILVWDQLFFTPGTFQPNPNKSAEWNRGAYLAEGLTHCGMCHTPKNALGGDDNTNVLHGYALQGWFAPDITNDPRRGIRGWSVEEIAAYLKTGHNSTSAATLRTGRGRPDSFRRSTERRSSSSPMQPRCCMWCCEARAAPPPMARRPHRRCRNSLGC